MGPPLTPASQAFEASKATAITRCQKLYGDAVDQMIASNRDAAGQSCKGAPFNSREGGAGTQRYHHPPEELQGQERIHDHNNTDSELSEKSPEALYDKEDGQSMASQNVLA